MLISVISVFAVTVMIILLANHIKDHVKNKRVFPFISLILTPLIMLHVFTIDVEYTDMVKLFIQRLTCIFTYDFLDVRSRLKGEMLKRPSFALIGYDFISLYNNMGIVFWLLAFFIICLTIQLISYTCQSKVDKLTPDSKLTKFILLIKTLSQSLYNYLAVHHIISLTSLTIYLWYEYYEKGCFDLECLISDTKISATKLVKLDVVITIILVVG